jgi:hypothetical protein
MLYLPMSRLGGNVKKAFVRNMDSTFAKNCIKFKGSFCLSWLAVHL